MSQKWFLIVPSLLFWLTFAEHAESADHKPLAGLPSVAEDQIFDDDWGKSHENAVSDRFTAILRRKFPVGSSESSLVQELQQEKFQFARPAQPGCIPESDEAKMPIGKTFVPCPHFDPQHHLRYTWAPQELPPFIRVGCSQTLGVLWESKDGRLTDVKGYFGGECELAGK